MDDTLKWVIGISITIIIFIVGFAGRIIYQGRKKREEKTDQKLKIHFDEIHKETNSILSDVRINEMYGLIVIYAGGVPLYHPDIVGIELPQLQNTFEAHFPKENEMYHSLIRKALSSNENYKRLRQKIKTNFESEGISVVNVHIPFTTSPVIYDSIFWPLFSWWGDRSQGKVKPHHNFEQIETSPDSGHNHLLVKGWGSNAIAYAETEADKQKCKDIISQIANNEEYESEAAMIIQSANKTLSEFRAYKTGLIDILDSTKNFWPGTKTYKFKIETKKCPRCKEIFS